MPDTPVEPAGGGRYPTDMETRVAILEHIAQTTAETLTRIERRFDATDGRFAAVDRRFELVDRHFESVDRHFEAVERHFETVERRLDRMAAEHLASFRWLLGVMLAGWGSVLGVLGAMFGLMAHGFHWF